MFEAFIQIYRNWDSEDEIPAEYGMYHHNIALVRMWRGRYAEAVASVRDAI